jgi:hypothetical protein
MYILLWMSFILIVQYVMLAIFILILIGSLEENYINADSPL